MHVGYIEFNHRAYKFVSSGSHGPGAPKFFSKVSQNLKDSARSSHCDGFTNYEFALEQVDVGGWFAFESALASVIVGSF